MCIGTLEYLRYGWQLITGSRVRGEIQICEERKRDILPYLDNHWDPVILDLANGSLRPQYTILAAEGRKVFGIDLVNRPAAGLQAVGYKIARALCEENLGFYRTTDRVAFLRRCGAAPFSRWGVRPCHFRCGVRTFSQCGRYVGRNHPCSEAGRLGLRENSPLHVPVRRA